MFDTREPVRAPVQSVAQLERSTTEQRERSLVAVRMPLGTCGRASTNHEDPTGADALWKTIPESSEGDHRPRHETGRGLELLKHTRQRVCDRRSCGVRANDL